MFDKLTRKVVALLHKRRGAAEPQQITIDANGLTLGPARPGGGAQRTVPWRDIARIVVFKRDLYAHDRISMAIETKEYGVIELSEDMLGWENLTRSLDRHLPSALPSEQWFMKVAFPAFELNPVEIYRRAPR